MAKTGTYEEFRVIFYEREVRPLIATFLQQDF